MQLTQKWAAYIAGRKLHWIILIGVLRAPMSFFDTTPLGRIINRFARDIDAVDSTLPASISQVLTTLITVVVTLTILIYGSWLAVVELIPLAILFAFIQVRTPDVAGDGGNAQSFSVCTCHRRGNFVGWTR